MWRNGDRGALTVLSGEEFEQVCDDGNFAGVFVVRYGNTDQEPLSIGGGIITRSARQLQYESALGFTFTAIGRPPADR